MKHFYIDMPDGSMQVLPINYSLGEYCAKTAAVIRSNSLGMPPTVAQCRLAAALARKLITIDRDSGEYFSLVNWGLAINEDTSSVIKRECNIPETASCGYVACIGGWMLTLPEYEEAGGLGTGHAGAVPVPETYGYDGYYAMAELLGIPDVNAVKLIASPGSMMLDDWPYGPTVAEDVTPKDAASALLTVFSTFNGTACLKSVGITLK